MELGGCAHRESIVRGARDIAELRALVEGGTVLRPTRGLYVIPGTSSEVVAARRASALLTCASAAKQFGLPLLRPPSAVHLALSGHGSAPRAGAIPSSAVLHYASALGKRRAESRDVLAPAPIALAHALRCLPPRESVAVVDSALNRGLISLIDLTAERPRAGKLAFERLVRSADGRSQSLPETFARLALRESGLAVEPQVLIAGVGLVDLLVERLVVVEIDGFAYHSDRNQFREDRRRDRTLQLIGIPFLRFTYEDSVRDTTRLVAEVHSLVLQQRRAGRRPIDISLRRGARDR